MGATPSFPTDALALVRRLDAGAIRSRLDQIEREREALRVLLRAALRIDSQRPQAEEATHAP